MTSSGFPPPADLYRLLVESVTDYAIYMVDPAGLITSWNGGAELISGHAVAEIIGQPFELMFGPEDRASGKARRDLDEALASGKCEGEGQRCRKDGSLYWGRYTVTPLRDGEQHIGFAVYERDISERKHRDDALRASENHLRAALDAGRMGTWAWDVRDNRSVWSERFYELLDLPPDGGPIDTQRIFERVHPDDVASLRQSMLDAFERGAEFRMDFRVVQPSGEIRWLAGAGRVRRDGDGTPTDMYGVNFDVTDQKKTEKALRTSEEQFRLFMDHTPVQVWIDDEDGVNRFANSALANEIGRPVDEITGRHIADIMPLNAPVADYLESNRRVVESGKPESIVVSAPRHDGTMGRFLVHKFPIGSSPEGSRLLGGVAVDVTERERARDELQNVQRRLALATKSARLGIWEWNVETNELVWDERMYELYGVPRDEFSGAYEAWQEGLHPEDRARSEAALMAALEGDEGFHTEFRVIWPNGEVRDIEAHGHVRRGGDGSPTHIVGVNWDITERKKSESGLRLRDRAIQAVSQGILITDPNLTDNPIIYASKGFEGITGYTSLSALGQNCRFLQGKDTDPATIHVMKEAILAGRECSVEILNYKHDGTPFWNALFMTPVRDDDGKLMHFVGVQADVTERRSLERAFQQSQKMEAVGRLAGGVAHDFNNLLTIISGYSDLLLMEMSATHPHHGLVVEIRQAGERAAGLTRQLLAFSRKQVIAPVVLDLNDVVAQTHKMLSRLLGEDITIAAVLRPTLPRVKADPGQIDQVVMNLCVNARDAMPTGGRLTIETAEVVLEEDHSAYPELAPGRYAQLSVTDTGHGMTDEVKAQIFEPFFTTKEPGKGTGLGLATVFGIVKQHSGRISVYSEVGIGTTFNILLPAEDADLSRIADSREIGSLRGTETILLVDDEVAVRRIARISLEAQGYKVLEAGGGAEAIQQANQHSGTIHLLVTDVVMPEMSGRQLADALHVRHPGVKVLFMSGYADDAVLRHGIIDQTGNFLQKPFAPLGLAKKVRLVLDET